MIRRALVAAAAVVVAVLTLIGVNRDMTEAPRFNVSTPDELAADLGEITVECQALSADVLDDPVWLPARPDDNSDRPRLTDEQFTALAESQGVPTEWTDLPQQQQYDAFKAAVRDNTDYFCAIARENQQAELVKTIGMGLIGLLLVGIAGIITLPKPRSVAPAAQAAPAAEPQE